jgi:uncharacterized protein involved in exopolysaccharide biosynthesis
LRIKYTPQHPDIIRLESLIADLQAGVGTEGKGSKSSGLLINDSGAVRTLKRQRYGLNNDINQLERDIANLQLQVNEYQNRVENTPKREQELLSLRRDYTNMNKSYNSLLQKKLEAELSVEMERKQKGEQFRIIDPARLPVLPIKPDLKLIFMMVIASGLAIGGGIIFLLEYQNSSFRDSKEIEDELGVSVLAMVPPIRKRREILRQRINWALSITFGFFTASLIAGYYCLSFLGADKSMAFARKYIFFLS